MPTVGFVGLGEMGGPIAFNLRDQGYELTVYGRGDGLERVSEAGATVVDTYPAVAAASDVVFLCLPGPEDVDTVVTGENGLAEGLEAGSVLVDTTTSLPATTDQIAATLAAEDVTVFSAPVSGGRWSAEQATLSVMVSGDPDVFDELEPLLSAFASNVHYIGERPGQGHALKLINNALMCTNFLAACEGIVLGERAGLDMETILTVVNESSGQSFATEVHLAEFILEGSFDIGFPLVLLEKDLRLYTTFAESLETPVPYGSTTRNTVGFARSHQGDETDITRIYSFFEAMMDRTDASTER